MEIDRKSSMSKPRTQSERSVVDVDVIVVVFVAVALNICLRHPTRGGKSS